MQLAPVLGGELTRHVVGSSGLFLLKCLLKMVGRKVLWRKNDQQLPSGMNSEEEMVNQHGS